MELYDAILTRRSVRKFLPTSVPKETLQKLLKAAMQAPSARNEQCWQFVVITDRKVLDAIASAHPYAAMAKEAPCAVLVSGDKALVKSENYWPQDLAAATQNFLLAAHAEGLGAVWVGIYPREDRCELFQKLIPLPENVTHFSFIPLGWPAEEKSAEDRFQPSRIHWGQW